MKTFIALFRGINVSGQKTIKMEDLRKAFSKWGFSDVKTYIQSGNVVFKTAATSTPEQIRDLLKSKVKEDFGYDVQIFIRTKAELEEIIQDNPFKEEKRERTYFTMLDVVPQLEKIDGIESHEYAPEEFRYVRRTIYFYSPKGYGKAKMNNNFFESKLKVNATTRNFNTLRKLVEMASDD